MFKSSFSFLFLCFTLLYLSLHTRCINNEEDEIRPILSSLDSIVFEQKTYTLVEGETIYTTATFYPATAVANLAKEKIQIDIEDASIIEAELIDFSNANASIKLIARKIGRTKIKISIEGIDKTFEAEINIKAKTNTNTNNDVPITDISLDKTELTIVKGTTSTLTALVSPENTTEDKSILWTSSDEQIATVNATGEITAIGVGEAIIIATSKSNNTLTATCKLIIVQAIIGVTLNNTELTIAKGTTSTLTALVGPTDATEDKSILWTSSDEQIATVNATGKITAIGVGEAIITATSKSNNTLTATCKLIITQAIIGITLNNTELTIAKGATATLMATVSPTDATEDNTILWTSSDDAIATVDNAGNVKAIGVGEAIITATSKSNNTLTATCKLSITQAITSVTLNKTELTIAKGATATLMATVSPTDATEDNTILWTSSDDAIATVDNAGNVKAIGVGEAIITATSKSNNTLTATCKLSITQAITSVTLNKTELMIVKGNTATLTATVSPTDATEDKTILWTSSDEAIATVNEAGQITAVDYGEATITATSKANAGISASCKVKVVRDEAQITQLYFAKSINDEVSYSRSQSTDIFYGIIDEVAKTITIEFSYIAELSSLSNVKLHFTLSEGAKVQVRGVEQKSAETVVDFSSGSVDYVVTAEDGITSQTYKVIIDHSTYAYIPGANFRTWLNSNYASAMKGDSLNTKHSTVITATEIYIYSKSIQDLTGIEFFTALFKLRCYDNALTELDLSKNVALEDFTCNDNKLKTLDMRGMRSTSNLIIRTSSTSNPLVLVKVHENMRNTFQLKFLKTERGTNIKIQTYSAPAGSTKYTAVCCDYDPNAGSCTTPATNGVCP